MAIVKVRNTNVHPYEEMFKGEKIYIAAGETRDMEYEEAKDFLGSFGRGVAPVGQNGEPDARYFKMLKIEGEPRPEDIFKDDGLTNHMTGKKASSAEELRAVLAEFGHLRVVDKDADSLIAGKNPEVEGLKSQVLELTALVKDLLGKKGPGRPKKEAS